MGKLVKILSVDGGGMRGIIPGMVLTEIERKTGKPISELFDLLSGTSIGAVYALGLSIPDENGKPKWKAEDMANTFIKHGEQTFHRTLWEKIKTGNSVIDRKYSSENSKAVFMKYTGDTKLKDGLTELLIPSYDLETGLPFFFKRSEARKNHFHDFTMLQALMATTAAPVFFEPYKIEPTGDPLLKHYAFIDGGIVANNPAMCAYVEAKTLFPDADEFMIVSLGTGELGAKILYEKMRGWGAIQWLPKIFPLIFLGQDDVVDHQMNTLLNTSGDKLNHYYRVQIRLQDQEGKFDKKDFLSTHSLQILGENLVEDFSHEIEEICSKLTK